MALTCVASASACDNDATDARVVNAFPVGGKTTVTIARVWYRTTLWYGPIEPGGESETLRVGTGSEPVYAVLAIRPSQTPEADAAAPAAERLVVARTRAPLAVEPGDHERIILSPATIAGPCSDGAPLSRDEYDDLAARIFPGDHVEPHDSPCEAPNVAPGVSPDAGSADASTD